MSKQDQLLTIHWPNSSMWKPSQQDKQYPLTGLKVLQQGLTSTHVPYYMKYLSKHAIHLPASSYCLQFTLQPVRSASLVYSVHQPWKRAYPMQQVVHFFSKKSNLAQRVLISLHLPLSRQQPLEHLLHWPLLKSAQLKSGSNMHLFWSFITQPGQQLSQTPLLNLLQLGSVTTHLPLTSKQAPKEHRRHLAPSNKLQLGSRSWTTKMHEPSFNSKPEQQTVQAPFVSDSLQRGFDILQTPLTSKYAPQEHFVQTPFSNLLQSGSKTRDFRVEAESFGRHFPVSRLNAGSHSTQTPLRSYLAQMGEILTQAAWLVNKQPSLHWMHLTVSVVLQLTSMGAVTTILAHVEPFNQYPVAHFEHFASAEYISQFEIETIQAPLRTVYPVLQPQQSWVAELKVAQLSWFLGTTGTRTTEGWH